MLISSARLRTRTGCFQCRKRRKKCDETRPRCTNCTRNGLDCEWPTGNEIPDRRKADSYNVLRFSGSLQFELSAMNLVPVTMPSPFQRKEHFYLYRYFAFTVLSRLVRNNSLSRYTDQTYMLRLAQEFPPLMGAMISIAGMQLAPSPRWSIHCAIQSYVHTITGLREAIADGDHIASNDALLATVISLSVFESSRHDTPPNTRPHIMASGIILAQRHPRWSTCPQAAAVFDRICVESFVYHASLMMLFDPSLDAFSHIQSRLHLSQYFLDPGHDDGARRDLCLTTQPILHVSYQFFLLIADATKLARLARPLTLSEIGKWDCLWHDLSQWPEVSQEGEDSSQSLYALCVQILVLKSNPYSHFEKAAQAHVLLKHGLTKLSSLDFHRHFPSYTLWPLAVLGSLCICFEEQNIVREYVTLVTTTKPGGQAAWVQQRLDKVWAITTQIPVNCPKRCQLLGLQVLLDGD